MVEERSAADGSILKCRTMRASLLLAMCLLTSFHLPLPLHAGQDGSGGYVISHTVNLVELPVTVRDRKGRFVSGLEQIGPCGLSQLRATRRGSQCGRLRSRRVRLALHGEAMASGMKSEGT